MCKLDAKSVIFDMDGVLINSMEFHCIAWRKAAKLRGIDIPDREIYLREGEKGKFSGKYFLELNGKDSSDHEAEKFLADKEKIFAEIANPVVYPFVSELLNYLYANSFSLALVTGTSMGELKKTLPREISDYFKIKVTGDMVSRGKPDPEPYRKALKLLEITEDEAVVIENAPYGIRSAKLAGIYCIALCTSLEKQYLLEADLILDSVTELYNRVKSGINCLIK